MLHTFCFLRPEGPSVNRPGRQAGIGRVNKMSTEGVAHLRGWCGTITYTEDGNVFIFNICRVPRFQRS